MFAVWFISLALTLLKAQEYDVLIKGGHVIDAKNNVDGVRDLAISGQKIAKVAIDIPISQAKQVIQAQGYYVTPGLIDMHVHVFHGTDLTSYIANGPTSVAPDGFTFRSGVTTVIDAGSAGWRNFRQFKTQTIDQCQTRVLALINIVGTGMYGRFEEQDKTDMNPEMTAYLAKRLFPQIIVGIKAAHYWGGLHQVDQAVEAGKLSALPVMVDFGEHDPPNSLEALFMQHLRPGDIFTHTFSSGPAGRENVVDAQGQLKPFVLAAQKRGIIFDVGHGGGAFSWLQAAPAVQQGFWPDVISTDLHTQSMNGGMKDLTNVLSKFLSLNMPLKEVIFRATWKPAQVINRLDLGHLSEGAEADIAIFSLRQGNFGFLDVRRLKNPGKEKLEAELTMRAGKVVWDLNGLASTLWNAK